MHPGGLGRHGHHAGGEAGAEGRHVVQVVREQEEHPAAGGEVRLEASGQGPHVLCEVADGLVNGRRVRRIRQEGEEPEIRGGFGAEEQKIGESGRFVCEHRAPIPPGSRGVGDA